jgi:hypothetical protein
VIIALGANGAFPRPNHLASAPSTPGTLVDQLQWDGGANQQWQLVPLGNGWSYIKNVGTGQLLTIVNNSTADGAYIEEWPSGAGIDQEWRMVPQGSSYRRIQNYCGKVLNPYGAFNNNGAIILPARD